LPTGHESRRSVFKKQPALAAEQVRPPDASIRRVGIDITDQRTVSTVENGALHLANRSAGPGEGAIELGLLAPVAQSTTCRDRWQPIISSTSVSHLNDVTPIFVPRTFAVPSVIDAGIAGPKERQNLTDAPV
jgi:hypothetical protein